MGFEFRDSDAQILNSIFEIARQRYLRQSRVTNKSSFNILRVLSAFKDQSDRFPSRKQQIYNWIIYIAKSFKPETYNQWKTALNQLSSMAKREDKNKSSGRKISYTYQPNHTINEFNHYEYEDGDSTDKQHATDMFMNVHNMSTCHDEVSKFKISRVINNKYMPISSKANHYISFEPCPNDNKENFNSQNTSKNEDWKFENYKCDNLPTRTPGDQSFIHYLPQSQSSPIVYSKITNQTKQMTQIDQQNEDEELVIMKTIADNYHSINLKMKSFSALLANFQALQSFQALYEKSRLLKKSFFSKRFFQSLDSFQKSISQKQNNRKRANDFYKKSLMQRSFKVLIAFSKLRIKNDKPKIFNPKILTPTGVDFILTLIFSNNEEMTESVDNPKSLRNKSKHFQQIEDSAKMEIISDYSSTNVKFNKQQIANIFALHRQARQRLIFELLKKNVRTFDKEIKGVQTIIRKSAINEMVKIESKKMVYFQNSSMLQEIAETFFIRNLIQKCFNGMFQFQLSKKIYAKRFEYLKNKNEENTLLKALRVWKTRSDQQSMQKLDKKMRFEKAFWLVKKIFKRELLREVKTIYINTIKYEEENRNKENYLIVKNVFETLKMRAKQKKIYYMIKESMRKNMKTNSLRIWKKKGQICHGLVSLSKSIKKPIFSTIKNEYKFDIHKEKLQKELISFWMKKTLSQLRISFDLDKNQQENKMKKTFIFIKAGQLTVFAKVCSHNIQSKRRLEKKNLLSIQTHSLKQLLYFNRSNRFLYTLKGIKQQQKTFRNKQKIVESVMGNRQIVNGQQLPMKVKTFTRCLAKMKKQVFQEMRNTIKINSKKMGLVNFIQNKKTAGIAIKLREWKQTTMFLKHEKQLCEKVNKKRKQVTVQMFADLYKRWQQKMSKSMKQEEKQLKFKVLIGLAKQVICSKSLQRCLQEKIKGMRKTVYSKQLVINMKQKMELHKKEQTLWKYKFIHTFKKHPHQSSDTHQNVLQIQNIRSRNVFQKLKTLQQNKQLFQQISPLILKCTKLLSVHKLQQSIFNYILSKKELFMAYKFRSIQLCKAGFKGLRRNIEIHDTTVGDRKNGNNYTVISIGKKYKHEHISTEYSLP